MNERSMNEAGMNEVTLIRGRWLITAADEPVQEDAAVAVSGAVVIGSGAFTAMRARYPQARLLGSQDVAVMPGLVNAHHHCHGVSTIQHGLEDLLLEPWILGFAGLRSGDTHLETLLSAAQQLRTGVTTVVDVLSGGGTADAYAARLAGALDAWSIAGARACVAPGISTQSRLVSGAGADQRFLDSLPDGVRTLARASLPGPDNLDEDDYMGIVRDAHARHASHPRIDVWFGPPGPQWVSDSFMQRIAEAAESLDTGIQTHVNESFYEMQHGLRCYGKPTMAHLRIDLPDPDDSLFSAGREALNRNNFRDAARLFEQLRTDYPRSNFVPSAMYWEAFSRYRLGGTDNLRQARQLLQNQIDRYPNANTHNDALTLAARLDGELARRGDAEAARGIAQELQNEECAEGENDVRIAALNALMNSNSERALPILKRVLERRDPCSVEMRKTALFVISQHGGDETAAILMDVVANDPDADMRGSAVFWLSQNPSPETIPLLDSLLRYSTDDEIRGKALFALAQQDDERAAATMRAVIQDPSMPNELRANAIFWLGQSESPSTNAYLRELYASLDDDELREQVLFAVSQSDDPAKYRWWVEVLQGEVVVEKDPTNES